MSEVSQMDVAPRQDPGPQRRWKEALAVIVGLGLAAILGLGVWFLVRGDASADPVATASYGPVIVDEATLRAETARVGHTVYWMPPEGRSLELTIMSDGTVHVRYFPAGADQPGSQTPETTVSSWPMSDPLARAQTSAASEGAMSQETAGGGLYVTGSDSPYNAYVAEPNATALGEVYDPTPGKAWRDLTGGKVTVLQP